MTSKELIKTLMTEHDITNAEMAKTLGITQAALWDRLNPKKSDNTTVAKLGDMLSVMGIKSWLFPMKHLSPKVDMRLVRQTW